MRVELKVLDLWLVDMAGGLVGTVMLVDRQMAGITILSLPTSVSLLW